jgi:3-methyladenine DNA glycosylase AlkD
MTTSEVLEELAAMGTEQTKKTFMRHGAQEPFYGVKIEDLKKLQKRIKKDHSLALQLYDTGVSDAMYLAALISDPQKMTKADLRKWAKGATWYMLSEYTVAWTAAESRFAQELAMEWIDSPQEGIASAGWSTYSNYVGIRPDDELDLKEIEQLLNRVKKEIQSLPPNRVRYTMNGFVIAVGGHVLPLTAKAKEVAKAIGGVEVNMGDTSCKVPLALEYIMKVEAKGALGKKKKQAMC